MSDTPITDSAILEHLSALRPFSCLPAAQLVHVVQSADNTTAPAGKVLIREGDRDRDYLVLLEGELEVSRRYQAVDGSPEIKVGRLQPGAGVGEMALLYGVPRQASVRATTAVRYLRIDGEYMDEMLAWSQRFAHELSDQADFRARMNLVRQIAPFRLLPLENVQRAFQALQPRAVAAGTTVINQGEEGDFYCIIEQGQAEVWRTDPITDDTALVATLGPGEAFGEEALLVGGYRNATVKMKSDGKILVLSKADFDALIKPGMVEEIVASQAQDMVHRNAARWLDCRFDVEYAEAHISGALLAPLDQLRQHIATLDADVTYIVYCRSGRRSLCAAYLLRERGIKAYSLKGGVRDWPYALEGAT